jgi:hypothetical protein
MKKDKYLILLLVMINVVLLGFLIYFRMMALGKDSIYKSRNEAYTNQLNYQKNIMNFQLFSEGARLDHSLLLKSEKSDSQLLHNVLDRAKLVLRYSELNCQTCVDAMLTQLQNNGNFNTSNCLLLAYYRNPAYLYQFKRMNRLQLPVYSINKTGLPPDTLNIPYFYLLDKDLRVSNVFIPEEGDTSLIAAYLRFAAKRLQSNK